MQVFSVRYLLPKFLENLSLIFFFYPMSNVCIFFALVFILLLVKPLNYMLFNIL